MNGLVLQETQGFNPFRFGVVGATDTHNSGGTPEEDNFHGKVGRGDGSGQARGSVPTCRWSTWDAIRAGVEPRPDLPATLQERAWSSPIWYVPGG